MGLEGNLQTARKWLDENGYDVLQQTRSATLSAYWDAEILQERLLADFIVRKSGRYYAVIVRNEEELVPFCTEQIYRKWFPLFKAFAVHGILELNIHTERVRFIDFEITAPRFVYWRSIVNRTMWFLGGVICAMMVMYKK